MAVGDIIVGMDIGTSKVSLVIGEVNSFNQVETLYTGTQKCSGIKKGKIISEEEIMLSISKLVKDAETELNFGINSAYVTIPGKYVTIVQNTITKDAKDKYAGISAKDVSSSIMQVKDITIPEGMQLIDIVEDEFILDNGKIVQDPIGSLSASFTLNAQVILADKEYIRKIANIFKKVDIDIDGLIPTSLAERNLILDANELTDNVLLIDIGAGNTELGVFDGNNFIYTNTIPLGGDNITNDISIVLGISEEEAERLKKQYSLAMKSYKDDSKKVIKSSELIEIIEARIEEIFTLVNKDITTKGIKSRINNVVLTGQGITTISKSDVAGKIILNIPVKIATGRLVSTIKPEYRTAYSLVRYIASKPFVRTVSSSIDSDSKENVFKNIVERIKEFFYS